MKLKRFMSFVTRSPRKNNPMDGPKKYFPRNMILSLLEEHPLQTRNYEAGLDPLAVAYQRRFGERKSERVSHVDLKNKNMGEAVLIAAEATHQVLGLGRVVDFECKPVDNLGMGKLVARDDPKLESANDKELISEGKGYPGMYWEPDHCMYLNTESVTDPMNAAATAIHETIHGYVEFNPGTLACVDHETLKEGAVEYATVKLMEVVSGDPNVKDSIEIAYRNAYEFFEGLGNILTPSFVVSEILNGDFTRITDEYTRAADSTNVAKSQMAHLVEFETRDGEWNLAKANEHLAEVESQLREKGFIEQQAGLTIDLADWTEVAFKQLSQDAQARALTDATEVMGELVPGNVFYVSSDFGILSYERSARIALINETPPPFSRTPTVAISAPFASSWSGEASSVAFPNLTSDYDPSMRPAKPDHKAEEREELIREGGIPIKKPPAEQILAFERRAVEERLKIREITDAEFDSITTFEDLFRHLRENYPPATIYHLQILAHAADVSTRLENRFGFPASPAQVARKVYGEALSYQDEYLVLGSVWDLTEHVMKKVFDGYSTRKSREYALIMRINKTKLDPEVSEQQYTPSSRSQIIDALGARLDDKSVEALFESAERLAGLLHVFEPTNQEIASLCKLILDQARDKGRINTTKIKEAFSAIYLGFVRTKDLGTIADDSRRQVMLAEEGMTVERIRANASVFIGRGAQA